MWQIITTSAEVTPKCGLVRESPLEVLNSGLGSIVDCPDLYTFKMLAAYALFRWLTLSNGLFGSELAISHTCDNRLPPFTYVLGTKLPVVNIRRRTQRCLEEKDMFPEFHVCFCCFSGWSCTCCIICWWKNWSLDSLHPTALWSISKSRQARG